MPTRRRRSSKRGSRRRSSNAGFTLINGSQMALASKARSRASMARVGSRRLTYAPAISTWSLPVRARVSNSRRRTRLGRPAGPRQRRRQVDVRRHTLEFDDCFLGLPLKEQSLADHNMPLGRADAVWYRSRSEDGFVVLPRGQAQVREFKFQNGGQGIPAEGQIHHVPGLVPATQCLQHLRVADGVERCSAEIDRATVFALGQIEFQSYVNET